MFFIIRTENIIIPLSLFTYTEIEMLASDSSYKYFDVK